MDLSQAQTKVGSGWHGLLKRLYRAKPAGCEITGVARSDGRLQITGTGITPIFRGDIKTLEVQSAHTCEDCGAGSGHRVTLFTGQVLILCTACDDGRRTGER